MSQIWKIIVVILALLGLPFLYAIEIEYLNRTLHAGRMMMVALIIGLGIGTFLGYRFQKTATDSVGRIRTYAVSIVLSGLVLPLLVGLSNRLLSFYPVQAVRVEFVEESPRYSNRFGILPDERVQANAYFTFFYKDQSLYKIQTRQSLLPDAQRGDTVTLPMKKGLWGFEFVVQRLR